MTALILSHPVFLYVLLVARQKEIDESNSEHTMKDLELVCDDPEDQYRPAASIHSEDISELFFPEQEQTESPF